MSDGRPTCVTTGLVALDIVLNSGSDESYVAAGGSCGNVTAILAYLGWKVSPVVRLGDDKAAGSLIDDLRRLDVQLDYVSTNPLVGTPVVVERLRRQAEGGPHHSYSCTCPNCGKWFPRYKAIRIADANAVNADAEVMYFDRATPGTIRLAERVAAAGGLVVFEPPSIGDEVLFDRASAVAHILKYSHERLGCSDVFNRGRGALMHVETLGPDGVRIRFRDEGAWRAYPAWRLPRISDTAGAGDWCTGGMLDALAKSGHLAPNLLDSADWDAVMASAQGMSAVACTFVGPRGAAQKLDAAEFVRLAETVAAGELWTNEQPVGLTCAQQETISYYCGQCP